LGHEPETVDPRGCGPAVDQVRSSHRLTLPEGPGIGFDPDRDIVLHRRRSLPAHSNGMVFTAWDAAGAEAACRTYYSVGGGFVADERLTGPERIVPDPTPVAYPFSSGAELLQRCADTGFSIARLVRENEHAWRTDEQIDTDLLHLWDVMQECIDNGLS